MTNIPLVISLAAKAVGVSPALLLALCFQESSHRNVFRADDGGRSSIGICQVQLRSAREVEPRIHASDLMNPRINARVAAKYLKKQIKRYGGRVYCGVNAYNAGHTDNCTKTINTRYVRRVKSHLRELPWLVNY